MIEAPAAKAWAEWEKSEREAMNMRLDNFFLSSKLRLRIKKRSWYNPFRWIFGEIKSCPAVWQ